MRRNRHSIESYAIMINGEIAFTVMAISEIGAVIMAAVDNRYRQILRERQGEGMFVTAKRIADM